MNTTSICLALGIASPFVELAGSFTDLDFEAVKKKPTNTGEVSPSQAFPGWAASQTGRPQPIVIYNTLTLGAGSVILFGTFPGDQDWAHAVISGHYSAGLQTGAYGYASLAQMGTIPVGSRSLLLDTVGDAIEVSLNGSLAPIVRWAEGTTGFGSRYDTYVVDVSALAGQEVELKLSNAPFTQAVFLDNIRFSQVALVPEPSTLALVGIGGALLWAWRRSRAS